MIAILVAAFVLSGAAGLIYETIWSRYLGLFVGHSAYAQIIVLVIFLGGMSLGAHLAGRRSRSLKSPLLWYAGVEMAVGLIALVFHESFVFVTARAYDSLFPSLGGFGLIAVKWAIAGALILPQSILLGATFPLMTAGVIRMARAEEAPGRLLGLLYFANSLGAAAGGILAGFVLIQEFGLPGTLLTAGFLNVVVALGVGLIARTQQRAEANEAVERVVVERQESEVPAGDYAPLLWVAFGTAIASFIYEIAWIRMLSLVLGSATHSFELMLSAFILGLALGAWWIRNRADRITNPVRFLGVVQWAMGFLAVATLPLYLMSFTWIAAVIQTVRENENGYRAFVLSRYLIALIVMLPATFCAGMTLPLITRLLMQQRGPKGGERAIGTVYAVNTLGSIAGVILAGLILMPLLGLKLLLVVGALVDISLGVWLVLIAWSPDVRSTPRFVHLRPLTVPLGVTAGLIALILLTAKFDLVRLTSGVYRHGVVPDEGEYAFPYYRDGRTATVSMRRGGDGFLTIATNGKPDASMDHIWTSADTVSVGEQQQLSRDIATQLLLPIISLAHAPRAANVAVIGQGSGMTSHVLLGSPNVKQVVTIEIEPEMIEASRFFRPANRRVFADPRSMFVIDDAKSYFASSARKFDLILSEPSNPWVSGVSGLFTQEFYSRVRGQLAPNGIFGQWLHLYELSDGLVTSVLAAIDTVFPAYEVFYTSNADIIVVAANQPIPAPQWAVVRYKGIASDMRRVVPVGNESFESLRLGGRDVLHPMLLARGAPNSDYFPVLDLGAERMRFMRQSADGYMEMSSRRFDVVAALSGRRAPLGTISVAALPELARSSSLALSARIRALRTLSADVVATLPRDEELRTASLRLDELDRLNATNKAPADWHAWVDQVVKSDADLHSGTAGFVDTTFFASVRAFAARTGAPAEARAAVDFLHGIGTWNWAEAAVSYKALMAAVDSVPWMPDVLLRNGGVVAFIQLRDYAAAKEVLRTFAKRTEEDGFRERLIGSYLIYQDPELRKKMGWK